MSRVWMVAEDDAVLRSILKMMLTLWEVDSLVFEDGNQAWEWLDKVESGEYMLPLPEVALLDIRMPGHLGFEVGRRMRDIAATSTIPLLIMTAYHLSLEDKALIHDAAHPEHIVLKPFPSLDDFQRLIETTIAANKAVHEPLLINSETVGQEKEYTPSAAEDRWDRERSERSVRL